MLEFMDLVPILGHGMADIIRGGAEFAVNCKRAPDTGGDGYEIKGGIFRVRPDVGFSQGRDFRVIDDIGFLVEPFL